MLGPGIRVGEQRPGVAQSASGVYEPKGMFDTGLQVTDIEREEAAIRIRRSPNHAPVANR